MARIRSFKPEFLRHEVLQDLEVAYPNAYVMLTFAGVWTVCDRAGRFEWKPRTLHLDILPFIPFDLGRTLDLLAQHGFLVPYEVDGVRYGFVPSWEKHQTFESLKNERVRFPDPSDAVVIPDESGMLPGLLPQGKETEGKGKGKGKGNGKGNGKGKEEEPPVVPQGGPAPAPASRKGRESSQPPLVDPSKVRRLEEAFQSLGGRAPEIQSHFEACWTKAPRGTAANGKAYGPGDKFRAAVNFATLVAAGEDPEVLRACYGIYLTRTRAAREREGFAQHVSTFFGLGNTPQSKATWQTYRADAVTWVNDRRRNETATGPAHAEHDPAPPQQVQTEIPLTGPIPS